MRIYLQLFSRCWLTKFVEVAYALSIDILRSMTLDDHDLLVYNLEFSLDFTDLICKIQREFKVIVDQGHLRSSILLSIKCAYATSY